MSGSVLLISNQPGSTWAARLSEALHQWAQLHTASESECLEQAQRSEYDLFVVDASAVDDSITLVSSLRREQPDVPIIVATSSPTWQRARQVFLVGATDYVFRTADVDTLRDTFRGFVLRSPSE